MLLKYFYDADLAQASYMVGCQQSKKAMIVDPARNIAYCPNSGPILLPHRQLLHKKLLAVIGFLKEIGVDSSYSL